MRLFKMGTRWLHRCQLSQYVASALGNLRHCLYFYPKTWRVVQNGHKVHRCSGTRYFTCFKSGKRSHTYLSQSAYERLHRHVWPHLDSICLRTGLPVFISDLNPRSLTILKFRSFRYPPVQSMSKLVGNGKPIRVLPRLSTRWTFTLKRGASFELGPPSQITCGPRHDIR
jgi:hypothetical protein